MLQPAPMVKSVDGQVKLRLMPNITVTHPIVSINPLPVSQPSPVFPSVAAPNPPELDNGNSNDSLTSALSFFDGQGTNTKADHFLDSVLENSNSSVLQTPPRVRPTPPTSPSRAVSSDTWIPDLSSFLGNIQSQQREKMIPNEDSVQSTGSEVD